ncbi:MAG: 4Fe-4S dicluster domain-containing protein [Desulfobacterales bacterium]
MPPPSTTRLDYRDFAALPEEPASLPLPSSVTLYHPGEFQTGGGARFKVGDRVRTGQRLALYEGEPAAVICTVTGTISSLTPYTGDFGRKYTAVAIEASEEEELDPEFGEASRSLDLEKAQAFFSSLPGSPDFSLFSDPDRPIQTLIVCGIDADLLVVTNQFSVRNRAADIKKGIAALQQITGVERIVLALPGDIVQNFGSLGIDAVGVSPEYPSGVPRMVAMAALGEPVPAGTSLAEAGVVLMSAEAVAAVGSAVKTGRPPVEKVVTVVDKDGEKRLVSVALGTPIRHILAAAGVELQDGDRIILGGPMTGSAIYSEDHPVGPDTDAVMIQESGDIARTSDYPCINCGECIRACPVNIPVNMLVRFLEAGKYEEGEDLYDLDACVECGLCSFVCVSRIPIFQYIRLAKYELSRMRTMAAEVEAEVEAEAEEHE